MLQTCVQVQGYPYLGPPVKRGAMNYKYVKMVEWSCKVVEGFAVLSHMSLVDLVHSANRNSSYTGYSYLTFKATR